MTYLRHFDSIDDYEGRTEGGAYLPILARIADAQNIHLEPASEWPKDRFGAINCVQRDREPAKN